MSVVAIFIEMKLGSKQLLLCFTYNPNKLLSEHHLNQTQAQLEIFCKNYKHLLLMGNCKANISKPTLTSFSILLKLKDLAKEPTCYKNPNNPSCLNECNWTQTQNHLVHKWTLNHLAKQGYMICGIQACFSSII